MTEAEWLNEQRRSQAMVWILRGTKVTRTKAGRRKLRLFACACCRLVWDMLNDPLLRQSVEVAERFAEAQSDKDELQKAYGSARGLGAGALTPDAPGARERTAASMAGEAARPNAFSAAVYMTAYPVPLAGYSVQEKEGHALLCELLRCIFGNPFRPVALDSAWLIPSVRALARSAYDERILPAGPLDADRLAVLADALEDAGCDNADILSHLRGRGPHVRGCWVVDLLLSRG
ncbi:MAG: hypothetical protein HYS12_06615 [Planctomycetes bacterium]|nr:hypothetical protein [Planctomycetota bacterium]